MRKEYNWFDEQIETCKINRWHRVWVKYSNWVLNTLILVLLVIALALIFGII